ncbi:uncharacterized protein TNCV_2833851 [Trichonephila clavipes]|nr:uncharacterized protein TNCV_2833851 [Trichonephila clavipes]
MDVCKCIVPSWHGGTLNSRRAANRLERLVKGEARLEAPNLNRSKTELHRFVTCTVLKATANDRRHLVLFHDEFRGKNLSELCQSGGISNNNITTYTKQIFETYASLFAISICLDSLS